MMMEKALSRSIRLLCAGSVVFGMHAATAQTQPEQSMQRVEITGSSIKRVDAETALPVQILTKAEIGRTGATSTQELLATISALSSAGSTSNATGAGRSTYGMSSISLRGLGDERTLVLVNGRRLAAFAGGGGAAVNVNVIPLAAIERVEVLKDGASGVYGSDAVAGVVNFILAKSFKGVEVTGGYGSPTEGGGGQNAKASITGGFGNLDSDRYAVVVSASYEKEKLLSARDRSYSAVGNNPPYYVAAAAGQGNIEGAIRPGTFPNDRVGDFGDRPVFGYGNPLADANKCESIGMFRNSTNTTKNVPYCAFDSAPFVGLIPDRELKNLTFNGAFKLNDNHQLFADALYSRSTVQQSFQPSPLSRAVLLPDAEFGKQKVQPSLLLYPSNPAYQSIAVPYLTKYGFTSLIGQPLAVTARVLDFGNRTSNAEATQSRLVVGAKGIVAGQDYEVALSTNESKIHGTLPGGYFSQVGYAKIINDPANNWNPWAPGGVQTGALAEKLKGTLYTGDTLLGKSKSDNFDAKLAGELPQLFGVTAQYAVGFQSRHDRFTTDPSDALENGDIAGLGGATPPVDRSRTINSVYAETSVPVLKTLDLGLALRHDDYNDVGSTSNYKINARWQPSRAVLVRASAGSGFRAPTLVDLWQPQVFGNSEVFIDPKTGTQLAVNAYTGGNPGLKPEESQQRSVGLVLSPLPNLTVGLDWFYIKVSNILSEPSAQEVVSGFRRGDPSYQNLVQLSGNGNIDVIYTTLANTGDAKVKGMDVFAQYRQNTAVGRFDFGLNGTYMSQFDQTSPGGTISQKVATLVDENGDPVLGANDGGVVLRWKHALSGTWSRGPWAATLTQNYTSSYETGNRNVDGERNFAPTQSTYDLNVAWKGWQSLVLNVGVRNLFDKQPSVFVPVSNQFQAGYDINQYDPRGRFVYVSAGYTFK